MKKKSHLSLASYLIDSVHNEDLKKYRKSFLFGSILPDCIPSFFTRRHTIDETFDILKDEIIEITENYDWSRGITREFCRKLGVITHYIADYFTYPHNAIYKGSMKEHISYEYELMDYFKAYLNSGDADLLVEDDTTAQSVDNICDYIKQIHKQYLEVIKQISIDCEYIVLVTAYIVNTIFQIAEVQYAQVHAHSKVGVVNIY